jgi:hypothetical protein
MSPTKATKKPAAAANGSKSADKKSPAKRPAGPEADLPEVAPTEAASTDAPPTMATDDLEPDTAVAEPAAERPSEPPAEGKRPPSAMQLLAQELAAAGDPAAVQRHAVALEDERESVANQAARLVQELSEIKPELLVSLIERFGRLLVSKNRRVVASSAAALAPLARIAPAKVAKQLPVLTQHWELTTEDGKDGLVRTFAGLCTASVAYQKRLEPALARALGEADPKLLVRWTEIVLPALKGEPHARARAVVEERLPHIPRPIAQKIADFLGIKLRPLPR